MPIRVLLVLVLGLAVVSSACGSSASSAPATTTAADAGLPNADASADVPVDVPAGCNPVVGDDCLTPFPSSFFETADPTTRTGLRVALPAAAMPVQSNGLPIKPDRLNTKDGFSPSTPFLVYLKDGIDTSSLPTWTDPAVTLTPASPVQVVEYATGTRVLAFAELDANARGDRQALLVRPLERLKPATRYLVALVGLKDALGAPLAPARFKALRDKTALSPSLEAQKGRYDEIFDGLEKARVPRASLSLAWDVTTASDETSTGHLVAMRDKALAMLASGALRYTITTVTETTADPDRLRTVEATIQVPSYLADDSGTSMMVFGKGGQPAMRAVVDVPIIIEVPRCAVSATHPLPVVVFGHGLFGTAKDTMATKELVAIANSYCAVFIGTDWIGLAAPDRDTVPGLLGSDLNNFYVISDRLQQAQLNAQVMTRMFLTTIKDDASVAVGGHAVTDGKEAYYFGVSNGGIQGAAFMALQPDIVRGVLNVPGGPWTVLINRSVDFAKLQVFLNGLLQDPIDQQVAIALTQSEWDYTDPSTFAPHLLSSPLPGSPAKRILVQESIGDAQVANVATRILARTMHLSGLDLSTPVTGIATADAPLDSAYTQWNSHATPLPPLTNTALGSDNGAHDAVWRSAVALSQITTFLRPDGAVTSVCSTTCDIGH